MDQKVNIIGSGFAGLSSACCLAKEGYQVKLFEKNNQTGGRARHFSASGFTFDMGPSWYWMPDVFDRFFQHFGKQTSDFYNLVKLDPGFSIFFGKDDVMEVPANTSDLMEMFENLEPGSAEKLQDFLKEASYKYQIGINELVYKPGHSITDFLDMRLFKSVFKMGVFQSFSSHVRKYFKHPKLIQLMEFPVLFLGAMPENTPALYSLMNYAALSQGTWYPMGGMFQIVKAMTSLAKELGVEIYTGQEVEKIEVKNKKAVALKTDGQYHPADFIVAGADYHHVEQHLLEPQYRMYSPDYWESRVMAPTALLFYLGINKKIKGLFHHNLFFDTDFEQHAKTIYKTPGFPDEPLFYACCPSKTDPSVAPEGMENLFLLIPLAPGLQDDDAMRATYFNKILTRLEYLLNTDIRDHIVYKRSYAMRDFQKDYHAFKSNAYGLANTLSQTAIFKPKMQSKKVKNLYFTGQLTVPGPGVPPSLISGMVAAQQIQKQTQKKRYETVI